MGKKRFKTEKIGLTEPSLRKHHHDLLMRSGSELWFSGACQAFCFMATKNLKFVTEYWQNLDVMWYMLAAKRLKCKCRLKMAAFLASNLFIKVLSPISVFVIWSYLFDISSYESLADNCNVLAMDLNEASSVCVLESAQWLINHFVITWSRHGCGRCFTAISTNYTHASTVGCLKSNLWRVSSSCMIVEQLQNFQIKEFGYVTFWWPEALSNCLFASLRIRGRYHIAVFDSCYATLWYLRLIEDNAGW